MSGTHDISLTVNGEAVRESVEPRMTLVDFLRDDLGLTGTHVGCEHGVCGACTVLLDGEPVRSCLLLTGSVDGHEVTTVEGLSGPGSSLHPVQQAFVDCHGLQCGFCTPGMLLTAAELLAAGGAADRATIREHLSGNYCRCTGYQAIVDVVEAVAQARAGTNT